MRTTFFSNRSTDAPIPSRICSITRTSWMSGRLRRTIASSVRRHAARIGKAAFLLPPGRIVPSSRRPPSTTKRSFIARGLYWTRAQKAERRAQMQIFTYCALRSAFCALYCSHDRGSARIGQRGELILVRERRDLDSRRRRIRSARDEKTDHRGGRGHRKKSRGHHHPPAPPPHPHG